MNDSDSRSVGIVGASNLTYAGLGAPAQEALEKLVRRGAIRKRVPQPAPALVAAREAIHHLYAQPDEAQLARLYDPEVLEYRSKALLLEELVKLRKAHGDCAPAGSQGGLAGSLRSAGEAAALINRPWAAAPVPPLSGELAAEDALRGRWKLACERGELEVFVTLTAHATPLVQSISWRPNLPPGDALHSAAARALALLAQWDANAFAELATPSLHAQAAEVREHFAQRAAEAGQCELGAPTSSDGKARASFGLRCARIPLVLHIALDEQGGRVEELRLAPPAATGAKCIR